MKRTFFIAALVVLGTKGLLCQAQDCSAPCSASCPPKMEESSCCASGEIAVPKVDACGCPLICEKCGVPEGYPCDPAIDVCQTGSKCVLHPASPNEQLKIGPIHQCMSKASAIIAKAPQALKEIEAKMGEEEDQGVFQMIGRLAAYFAKKINEERDGSFHDQEMKEAMQCENPMDESGLFDHSIGILKGALEKDFMPKGFIDKNMDVGEAIGVFAEQTGTQKFDIKNLIPVLESASKVQGDYEQMVGKIAMSMPEEDHDDHYDGHDYDKPEPEYEGTGEYYVPDKDQDPDEPIPDDYLPPKPDYIKPEYEGDKPDTGEYYVTEKDQDPNEPIPDDYLNPPKYELDSRKIEKAPLMEGGEEHVPLEHNSSAIMVPLLCKWSSIIGLLIIGLLVL